MDSFFSVFMRYQGVSSLKKPISFDLRSVYLTVTRQLYSVTRTTLLSFHVSFVIDKLIFQDFLGFFFVPVYQREQGITHSLLLVFPNNSPQS